MIFRLRWPGSPRLQVDARGLRYIRGGREQRRDWRQVTAIHVDYYRDEMRFLSADLPPVVVHRHMTATDGRRFDILVEDYWQPPPDPARRRQGC